LALLQMQKNPHSLVHLEEQLLSTKILFTYTCLAYSLAEHFGKFPIHPEVCGLSSDPSRGLMDENDVNSSSFLDLKVAVLKKKREAEQARESQRSASAPCTARQAKQSKKNTTPHVERLAITYNESEEFAKSQAALEGKSRIYDQLQRGEAFMDDMQREMYMVDFDRKGWDEEKQQLDIPTEKNHDPLEFLKGLWNVDEEETLEMKDEELVEYIDEFGRSRMIRPSEKAQLDAERAETQNILLGLLDDLQHQEGELAHYDAAWEIRDKGIGFFAFSRTEEDRQRQMQALRELRKRTVEERTLAMLAKEQRLLEREHKRIRLEERRAKIVGSAIFSQLSAHKTHANETNR